MRRRSTVVVVILLGLSALAAIVVVGIVRRGISARGQPTGIEATIARRLRHLAIPRGARDLKNPVPASPEVLRDAMAHFADHCASCHGNDGKGQTAIGQNLYPKAPDMTGNDTQHLSDGELFYIIKNGVRFTGMPAWGEDTPQDDHSSWGLVRFLRYLPKLTPAEVAEMGALNPKSPEEWKEEEEIRGFLEGGEAAEPKKEAEKEKPRAHH